MSRGEDMMISGRALGASVNVLDCDDSLLSLGCT